MKSISSAAIIIIFTGTLYGQMTHDTGQALYQQAVVLAQRFIIIDGHIDLPYRLQIKNFRFDREYLGIPISTDDGDFDYERARKGGLDAPFMAIYIPSSYQEDPPAAKALADSLIDMVYGIIDAYPDKFARAGTPQDIEDNTRRGLMSFPLGLENGAPIVELEDVKVYFDRGIRYVTLTHGRDNHICDSSYDTTGTWGGLSPYGVELVKEMNRVGMIIDVSHISDRAFYQVLEHTSVPVLATHSSCRAFTPGWERNMSDDMIAALARNGGVMMVNFGSDFLDAEVSAARKSFKKDLLAHLEALGLSESDEEAAPAIDTFRKNYPTIYADVKHVADHIDHIRNLVGIDHIGIGSDFDGVGDSLPFGLKDVSMYPNLIHELLKRGYSEDDIAKICYKNAFRVWQNTINFAAGK